MRFLKYIFRAILGLFGWMFSLGFAAMLLGIAVCIAIFAHYSRELPDYSQLARYDPPTITRLYAADGRLMAEYAEEKRIFVPLSAVPKRVQLAFIAAEDKNFYEHTGIDFTGVARAIRDNVVHYGQGKSLVGGSTITQQVVKNFLLTNEKSIERKIKEAILAMRISQVYSKDKILELYLNEIYLGLSSYGVAAASQNYFNKSLDELTIDEAALLAAQPKAPSEYNPKKNYELAKQRRDWVIDRMREDGYITAAEADAAKKTPITLRNRDPEEVAHADYFAEEVRRWLAEKYGESALYEGGLVVRTTLDPVLQQYADSALRRALIDYDRKRGYRGPSAHLSTIAGWKDQLNNLTKEHAYQLIDGQKFALVMSVDERRVQIAFADETRGILPIGALKWMRRMNDDGSLGPEIKRLRDVFKIGDVVMVGPLTDDEKKALDPLERKTAYDLEQVPEINGALIALDPHTGRVLAMSGGYSYGGNEFNRATQAKRQPGSSFKPFVYLTGLENGFTPSTIIVDGPVEMSQGEGLPTWKPQNYHDEEYLGPATMRVGLEKSRNTMTVRMAQIIGLHKIIGMGKRLGIYDELSENFSIVLGSAETTLFRLANAYGMIDNGGRRITPSLIERIDDRHGQTIYRRDDRQCAKCLLAAPEEAGPSDQLPPIPADTREQLLDPRIAYEMTSMLQGVTTRGTGAAAHLALKNIVAGKTGTTNDSVDTWFIGFSPDLVTGVFVGYDKPKSLGEKETGASVALPAFISFMKEALANVPNKPFRVPPGVQLVKVDLKTGLPVSEAAPVGPVIDEAFITGGPVFIPGITPEYKMPDANTMPANPSNEQRQLPVVGTGALY